PRILRADAARRGQELGHGRTARAATGSDDLVQRAAEIDDVELTRDVLAERRDAQTRVEQLLGRVTARAVADEAPDPAAAEVAEHVRADERRDRRAAVNVAARHRHTERAAVLMHGV